MHGMLLKDCVAAMELRFWCVASAAHFFDEVINMGLFTHNEVKITAAGQYRVTRSKARVYHPMGSVAVNCCLFSYQLSFLVERKLQRIAAQGRTYGSPQDPNSLVTHAAPR